MLLLLLIAVLFGLGIGYFATQNTGPVTIQLGEYALRDVPLYVVIVGSAFLGLFAAWILYVARGVSSRVTIYGKDYAVKKAQRNASTLEQRVQELEAENAALRGNGNRHLASEPRPHVVA
jgi:uncharacterized integral membrane protein